MVIIDPRRAIRGRGATLNPTGRFESRQLVVFDDGWGDDGWSDDDRANDGSAGADGTRGDGARGVASRNADRGRQSSREHGVPEQPLRLATQVFPEKTRQAITRNESPDIGFDRSINPYKGCEHGCIYCFARPTHAYLGLSPGIDFETKIFSKPDAPERLRAELSRPSYRCAPITLGANTDPYQPVEREQQLSRRILEVLHAFKHPVSIITKSALVQRDSDILSAMASERLAQVFVSVTTLDRDLARIMEPRAATPERRLETIAALNAAGVPTHVLVAPLIPCVNDSELEHILEAVHERGARRAGYVLLRLPLELKELFEAWLQRHFPERKDHVLNLIRSTRGGELYDSRWGLRGSGTGPYAQALSARFAAAARRLGLNERSSAETNEDGTPRDLDGDMRGLDTRAFRVPPRAGDQMKLTF